MYIYFMGLAERTPLYVSIYSGVRTGPPKIAYVKHAMNGWMDDQKKSSNKFLVPFAHMRTFSLEW